jgi:hypothetical protein
MNTSSSAIGAEHLPDKPLNLVFQKHFEEPWKKKGGSHSLVGLTSAGGADNRRVHRAISAAGRRHVIGGVNFTRPRTEPLSLQIFPNRQKSPGNSARNTCTHKPSAYQNAELKIRKAIQKHFYPTFWLPVNEFPECLWRLCGRGRSDIHDKLSIRKIPPKNR